MQVGGLSQKDIMSEWKRAFLISQTSRAQPMEQREQKPTDGAARGEAKLAWAIPSRDRGRQSQPMEQREERPSLLGLSRNIVQTRAESSLLGLCRVQPIFNEVNRDRGRQSQPHLK